MRYRYLATFFAAMLLLGALLSTTALAKTGGATDEDTDTHIINAEVVEATDARISVIARSGVEHVIAVDSAGTKVMIDGRTVSLKDVKVGDIITIELDEKQPVKFARNISLRSGRTEVARNRR